FRLGTRVICRAIVRSLTVFAVRDDKASCAARVLATASRVRGLSFAHHARRTSSPPPKSPLWRDATTNTRRARATQSLARHVSSNPLQLRSNCIDTAQDDNASSGAL